MMWVPTRRRDATFHARTSGSSAGSPQSPSPPVPATYPSSVTPICKTTCRIAAPSQAFPLLSGMQTSIGLELIDANRRADRQAETAHGLAVGHGDRVESQVQFSGQVKRDPFRALRFHDHLILAEDGVLELLDDPVRLAGVVV